MPNLPPINFPEGFDKAAAESLTGYCNQIQLKLNKLADHMKTLGQRTKHTRSTREALLAIENICPEIEAAILAYLAELSDLELKPAKIDPVFDYEPEGMDQ